MIAIDGLVRSFGDFQLGELSLKIERGDYWVVLGPSGSGKSMLLQTLAGIFVPDAGRVCIGELDATRLPPERRNVGLVFQQSALFPHMTVEANIAYGLRARRTPEKERKRRVDELITELRLESMLSKPTATLSGGEAQKVAIARALAPRPELLLLDEPLGPIDHNTRIELQGELERIHSDLGTTTLHVTHSREEALALGAHCAVMRDGRIEQSGPTADVFASPATDFVAEFLGSTGKPKAG